MQFNISNQHDVSAANGTISTIYGGKSNVCTNSKELERKNQNGESKNCYWFSFNSATNAANIRNIGQSLPYEIVLKTQKITLKNQIQNFKMLQRKYECEIQSEKTTQFQ